jgi:hypothetical protein
LSREQHAALFAVINKVRMLNGWTTKTAQELDATIRTWAEVFDKHRIPVGAYNDIYLHAFDTRSRKLADGKDIELDATLMVASWPAVADAYKRRMIIEGRTLPARTGGGCQQCFGSGMRPYPEQGGRFGPCNHEEIYKDA